MRGIGTICNVLAVVFGSGLGIWLKSGLSERFQNILMQACSMAVIFIGASGAVAGMLTVTDGVVGTQGTIMLVLSLVLGGLLGEWLNIEGMMNSMGERMRQKFSSGNDSLFAEGFVTTSLVICMGAMAVVGAINDGLTGDYSMLLAKSMIDFVLVMVFASTLGLGVMFSAIPLAIYQGSITLFASFIAPFMTASLVSNLSFIGSVLVFGVGINLLRPKTFRMGNLLPSLLVPIIWEFISRFI